MLLIDQIYIYSKIAINYIAYKREKNASAERTLFSVSRTIFFQHSLRILSEISYYKSDNYHLQEQKSSENETTKSNRPTYTSTSCMKHHRSPLKSAFSKFLNLSDVCANFLPNLMQRCLYSKFSRRPDHIQACSKLISVGEAFWRFAGRASRTQKNETKLRGYHNPEVLRRVSRWARGTASSRVHEGMRPRRGLDCGARGAPPEAIRCAAFRGSWLCKGKPRRSTRPRRRNHS